MDKKRCGIFTFIYDENERGEKILRGIKVYGLPKAEFKVEDGHEALQAMMESNDDGAINKFNEIVAFMNNIADTSTLEGILGDIASAIQSKQDTISDLSEIRSKAGSAVQPTDKYTYNGVEYSVSELLQAVAWMMPKTFVTQTVAQAEAQSNES